MVKAVAILRWTGRGSFTDLQSAVRKGLAARRPRGRVTRVGSSLVVQGPEPVETCLMFEFMPGVAWGAVGYSADGLGGIARAAAALAPRYLKRGTRFSVEAEAKGGILSSDLAGAATSAILEKVKGARADVVAPRVRFRAAIDGAEGVVGVELSRGPGGVPTGKGSVTCLVSGGVHSSVVAWLAALSGFRVRLVHAMEDEPGLRAAAKLYSELSNRMDPGGVTLTVLDGGSPAGLLAKFVTQSAGPIFGGFRVRRPAPRALEDRAESPLYLMPEESFETNFESLRLKARPGETDWEAGPASGFKERSFGGVKADVSGVLDGLG